MPKLPHRLSLQPGKTALLDMSIHSNQTHENRLIRALKDRFSITQIVRFFSNVFTRDKEHLCRISPGASSWVAIIQAYPKITLSKI